MMIISTRPLASVSSILVSLLLLLVGTQAASAAEDMWEGVFAYQKKMAEYGNAEAQNKLGEMYEEGHGTAQNFDLAREWYEKAAAQGYAQANERIKRLEQRKQRALATAKAAEERRVAEEARQEREKEEQYRAEHERIGKEKAEQEKAEKAASKKAESQRLARQREEEKKRQAEEERLARKRAEEAMKAMMATPSAYADE